MDLFTFPDVVADDVVVFGDCIFFTPLLTLLLLLFVPLLLLTLFTGGGEVTVVDVLGGLVGMRLHILPVFRVGILLQLFRVGTVLKFDGLLDGYFGMDNFLLFVLLLPFVI